MSDLKEAATDARIEALKKEVDYWKEQYHKMKEEVDRLSLDLGIKEKFFNQGEVK